MSDVLKALVRREENIRRLLILILLYAILPVQGELHPFLEIIHEDVDINSHMPPGAERLVAFHVYDLEKGMQFPLTLTLILPPPLGNRLSD